MLWVAVITSCNISEKNKADEKKVPEIKSIVIGEQTWSAENINISYFQNGDSIPEAKTEDDWIRAAQDNKPVWSYYNFDKRYEKQYGKLYNWYAITDPRGFAPKGWRVPTLNDWNILFEYCGGVKLAANKLKVSGNKEWQKTNSEISNQYNFSALPGGFYETVEMNGFWSIGRAGMWWTSDVSSGNNRNAMACLMSSAEEYLSEVIIYEKDKGFGLSVRIVSDKDIVTKSTNQDWPVFTKVMTYKWCECEDICLSSFLDENGAEYNFGNPSTDNLKFDCNIDKESDLNKDRKFIIKFKDYGKGDYSIIEIKPADNVGNIEPPQYSSSIESDIVDYLTSHSFTYEGNGLVTFSNRTLTVKGNGFTLIGEYSKISNNAVKFDLRVVDGNFDASRNRTTYGTFTRNSDGSLTEVLSDGVNTRTYRLIPAN